jgi:ubiquitin-protein ligase
MDACAHGGNYRTSFAVDWANSEWPLRQLVSVISLLSSDMPNLESPANVDAAIEVRNEPDRK